MDDKEFQEYIEKKYLTKYATYCVYDNEGNLIHPDKVFKQDFVFLYENTCYCSRILKNPRYGEILVFVNIMSFLVLCSQIFRLYVIYIINNRIFTLRPITPAAINDLSNIKYPCNNHKILVVKISIKE
jgi:hypothetical protein